MKRIQLEILYINTLVMKYQILDVIEHKQHTGFMVLIKKKNFNDQMLCDENGVIQFDDIKEARKAAKEFTDKRNVSL